MWLFIVTTSYYVLLSLGFAVLDMLPLDHWKIRVRDRSEPYWSGVRQVIENLILVNLPLCLLYDWMYDQTIVCPSIYGVLWQLFCFVVVEEVCFYGLHRLFHTKVLYRFHKIHHEWKAPVAYTAIYAHPLEHFVVNLLPSILVPVCMSIHYDVMLCFLFLMITNTLLVHSGYAWTSGVRHHDAHHERFNVNYGITGWMDYLFGTSL